MRDEEYNIVCKGELVAGFEQSTVIQHVGKLFKIDEKKALQILDKRPRILMKRLKWEKAVRSRKILKNIGLVVTINIALNADIFRESLTLNSHQSGAGTEIQVLKFDTTQLVPTMFAQKHSETLVDYNKEPKFLLESYNHILNQKFLLLLSSFAAIAVQKYFGLLLVQNIPSPIVTPLLILLFFLIIVFLPKIMTTKRVFTLRHAEDNRFCLLCYQESSMNPIVDTYRIYSYDDELLATVKSSKLKNKIECRDVVNNVLYSSSDEKGADDVVRGAATEIRNQMFDFSSLSYLDIMMKLFEKIKSWYGKERPYIQEDDMFVVRDTSAKKVAYFHRDNIGTIKYPIQPHEENRNMTMIAFLLICLGIA
ncbi:MAG: hypothetical protein V2B20_13150 [Pseudomonadota bacterium]